ncbi:MAG TPA: DNA polymerase III subunit beta [Mycobacteriales bacterium]
MRFRVERDEFADAVGWVTRGLPSRPAVPVLAGVLLETDDGRVSLSTFDHQVSSQTSLDAVDTVAGRVLVSGHLLAPIARTLPDHPVEISVQENRARLHCGPVRFNLPLMPVEDHPVPPPMPPAAGRVHGARFAAAVTQVATAVGRDEALPMLTGVHLSVSAETLTLSTTDRYRLAVCELPWEPVRPGLVDSVLVPARMLTETARALASASTVTLCLPDDGTRGGGHDGGMIGIDAGDRRTMARLLDVSFPRVEQLWPLVSPTVAELPARTLVDAIGRVCLVAGPRTPVHLSFEPGTIRVSAGEPDEANAEQDLSADVSGEPVTVTITAPYLLDGLRGAGTRLVRLALTSSGKPVVIAAVPSGVGPSTTGFRYLAMSLRMS